MIIFVFWISLNILPTCSMNPETAVTCTRGHFNQVVFAVIKFFPSKVNPCEFITELAMNLIP